MDNRYYRVGDLSERPLYTSFDNNYLLIDNKLNECIIRNEKQYIVFDTAVEVENENLRDKCVLLYPTSTIVNLDYTKKIIVGKMKNGDDIIYIYGYHQIKYGNNFVGISNYLPKEMSQEKLKNILEIINTYDVDGVFIGAFGTYLIIGKFINEL